MRPSLPHPAADERGFILVGVVMFMLALTILGLSLFALSSYESQFFISSAAREQSLQNSESGMELVKALLAAPGRNLSRLDYAHRAEGQMGVLSAMAYQWRSGDANDTTSSGPVDWNDSLVIVVTAKSGGVERTLQAKYMPGVAENPYQRLLVAGQGVAVNTTKSSSPSVLVLSGRAWQPVASGADTAWTQYVSWTTGRPVETDTPPTPLADAFVDDAFARSPPPAAPSDTSLTDPAYMISFQGSPAFATFYRSPGSPTADGAQGDAEFSEYSFYANDDLDINVQGVAVWVVDQGICIRKQLKVTAIDNNIPSTLVIVAKANLRDTGHQNRGIWFRGGLIVGPNVHVYLVSQGDVSIVHDRDDSADNLAGTVSIVAGGQVEIGGPRTGYTFTLGYDPPGMDALADQLLALGALPNVMGGGGSNFKVIRGSWLETTPQ
jgi:hypothetical protein